MPPFPDADEKHALAEDCRRCPALVDARECISWGNGPLDADLVVVGEAPGSGDPTADEWQGGNYTGMAYTNRPSGRKIRTLLADAGFGHDECFFTNAVKCHPEDDRDPTGAELESCRPYLRGEIETVDPQAVVTIGKHATRSVFALDDIEMNGFLDSVLGLKRCSSLGVAVVPLLHPSYQEVWLSRLGYDRTAYVERIRETIETIW
ncbi:uracil-DNA glycosylase [Halobacteriales archaeon QS_4_62_28]|nr:MAG: uracil-DNA glycosylase [Halobacteriales archaeon QS_4_62_28]